MSLAGLLVVILLIVGVKRLIPAFLIVHIVGQLISAVTVIILIMVQTFYFGYREKLEDESEERTSIAIKLAIVVGITVAIAVVQIYVIYLLLRCIAFIKAKAEAERVSSNMWKSVETNRRQSAAPAGTNGLRRESRSATEVLSVVRLETPRRESGNPRRNSNRP